METYSQELTQQLEAGDLLFQLCKGGEVEWLISRLFPGINGLLINHVAMYAGNQQVIEATAPRVQQTSLNCFIKKSVVDTRSRPCLTICRLKRLHVSLIPGALDFARECLHEQYDSSYGCYATGWYCSQLVLESFRHANQGDYLFHQTPMSFRDPETGQTFPYWRDYYKKMGVNVPEGQLGSHPATLSTSEHISPIISLGGLAYRNVPQGHHYGVAVLS